MLRCSRTRPWSPTTRGSPGRKQSGHLGLVKLIADERRTESCRNEAIHLVWAGVSFEGCLREEQLAIERHLEPAVAARQQHRPGDPRRPRVEELSHQTGGSIRVVSDDAELDLEFMRSVDRLGVHARTLRCDACRRTTDEVGRAMCRGSPPKRSTDAKSSTARRRSRVGWGCAGQPRPMWAARAKPSGMFRSRLTSASLERSGH